MAEDSGDDLANHLKRESVATVTINQCSPRRPVTGQSPGRQERLGGCRVESIESEQSDLPCRTLQSAQLGGFLAARNENGALVSCLAEELQSQPVSGVTLAISHLGSAGL